MDNQDQSRKVQGQISGYIFTAVIGGLFIYFSVTDGYNGDDCVQLKYWAFIFGVTCVSTLLITLLLIPLCFAPESCFKMCAPLITLLSFLIGLLCLVFFVFLNIAYYKGEACGDLRTLSMVYIYFVYTVLFLACCCGCCFLSLVGMGR